MKYTLRKKYPYSELFGSAFSRIRTEYGVILRVSPYSVRMPRTRITPNTDTFHAVIVCTKCFKNQPSAKLNPLKKQKYDAQKIKSAQKLIYFTGLKSRYHAVINEERCSEKQNVITNYFEITGKKLAFPWEFDLQSIQCNNIPIKNILYCRSAVKYSNFALSFFGILSI